MNTESNPFVETAEVVSNEPSIVKVELSKQQIKRSKADMIEAAFAPMVTMLRSFDAEVEEIKGQDITEELTQRAKALRLRLVKVRTATAKIHKEQKDDALKEGRAIDGVKNILEYAVSTHEKDLAAIENHFINIEREKKLKLFNDRVSRLSAFIPESDAKLIPLGEMAEEAFENMLRGYQAAKEAKLKWDKEQEQKQIEADRLKKEEDERIRIENQKLKVYSERISTLMSLGAMHEYKDGEKVFILRGEYDSSFIDEISLKSYNLEQWLSCVKQFSELAEIIKDAKHEKWLKEQKQKKVLEDKLKQEREGRKRLEVEAQEKAEQEENERKEKLAAERKLKRAPDRVKLQDLANKIELLSCEPLKDEEAQKILNHATGLLAKVKKYILDNAENL